MSTSTAFPVLVEITRGSVVESRHRGLVAVVDADGNDIASLGDIRTPCFFRSAAKPFQAMQLILSGAEHQYGIEPRELALVTGSHNGEPQHVECVTGLLRKLRLAPEALRCGVHPPFNAAAKAALGGAKMTVLHNNCSGKHAAMLACANIEGFPLDDYDRPTHPVQEAIVGIIAAFAGTDPEQMPVAVDGCTVPTWAVPLRAIALAYARLAYPDDLNYFDANEDYRKYAVAARHITDAMLEYPDMVGGTDRIDTDLMNALPYQLVSKVGAEGVHAMALMPRGRRFPHGLGIAVKIEDGDNFRARNPVAIAVLEQLGLLSAEQAAPLKAKYCEPIRDLRGRAVGEVRIAFHLER